MEGRARPAICTPGVLDQGQLLRASSMAVAQRAPHEGPSACSARRSACVLRTTVGMRAPHDGRSACSVAHAAPWPKVRFVVLYGGVPAVDEVVPAGDERRLLRQEEAPEVRDLFGST